MSDMPRLSTTPAMQRCFEQRRFVKGCSRPSLLRFSLCDIMATEVNEPEFNSDAEKTQLETNDTANAQTVSQTPGTDSDNDNDNATNDVNMPVLQSTDDVIEDGIENGSDKLNSPAKTQCPSTPVPRPEAQVESPWKRRRIVSRQTLGVSSVIMGKTEVSQMSSSGAGVKQPFGEVQSLEEIWSKCASKATALVFLLVLQPVCGRTQNGAFSIYGYGLDRGNQWVKICMYGPHAVGFQQWFSSLGNHSEGVFVKFSNIKHGQSPQNQIAESLRSFIVQPTSQWQEEPGYADLPEFQPMPQFCSEFSSFDQGSSELRAFLVVKVHEHNGVGNGGKLDVVLSDMSGSLRNAAVWSPANEDESLFEQGKIIMVFGAKLRREYNQWSIGSDAVVQVDKDTCASQFPDHVRFGRWTSPVL